MRKNNRLIPLFLLFIAMVALWQMARLGGNAAKTASSDSRGLHQLKFFNEKLFYKSLRKINEADAKPDKEIKGGIAPHHLLATEMISEFYSRLKNQNIETVIIIGPNHKEVGDFPALNSTFDWDTPFGRVLADEKIISELVGENLIKVNDEILENEHSVALHMPFVKYFLPNAKVVPIIISGKMSIEEVEKISAALAKYARKKGIIIIASVDFSHYLPETEAMNKDNESLEAIKNFDFQKIRGFGNDNLDSPPSIIVLLSILKRINAADLKVIKNLNSEYFAKSGSKETTSYFTILFGGK